MSLLPVFFDEILKILFSGYSRACLKRLNELGIPEVSIRF